MTSYSAHVLALVSGCAAVFAASGCESPSARPAVRRYGEDPRRPVAPAAEPGPAAPSPADDLVEHEAGQMAIEDQQRAEQATKEQEAQPPPRRYQDRPLRRP